MGSLFVQMRAQGKGVRRQIMIDTFGGGNGKGNEVPFLWGAHVDKEREERAGRLLGRLLLRQHRQEVR